MSKAFFSLPPPQGLGGLSPYRSLSVLNTGLIVKNAAGSLYGWHLSNSGAAIAYVKFYDKATAATSSDTPVLTIALGIGVTISAMLPFALPFAAGIGIRAVTGVADNNNTAVGANEVVANLFYA